MQKFTIFTVIISTIVITVIAELVIQDYLQKLYNPGTALQANTLGQTAYVAPFKNNTQEASDSNLDELKQRLQDLAQKNTPDTNTDSDAVTDTAESELRPSSRQEILNNNAIIPFERVESLLPALQIPDLKIDKQAYNKRLFQLIDTSSINFAAESFGLILSRQDTIGSTYEFSLLTSVDAENAFDEIRILANSFPNIDTNQTNQFGDRSFYINHLVKVGEVFLVVQQENQIFAFAYKKEYHETFKTFFGVLY